ncbi:stomatin family protein [Athelia psychrophila]|uniref:Stomatin family protein n=1 Tax=Athelia psychrophila TaxID=1759441 RepID=A0A166UYY2_9AGAM|nr:stomatin family protein [Fibularhizoctonia sp. CBS 109695]
MSALRVATKSTARSASRALKETRMTSATHFSARRGVDAQRTLVTVIEQGKEAWRLSLGKNPVRLGPGLHLNLPVYHDLQKVDMRECSLAIQDLPGYTSDNVPVSCSGSLFFRITDSYKACFAISDVEQNIQRTGTSVMRSVLGGFSYDEVIANRNSLNEKLNVVIGDSIANWGVECTRFEIQTFKPANREVERQLELQMEAERNRRKQLLDTKAQVNIAEGNKERVILESEGHLVAKSNEADAAYKTVFREAEARKQQSLMEISALAQQVEELAKALSKTPDVVDPEARLVALEKLVELRRLEQLQAIASSQSNSTYFFGDRSALGQDGYSIDYAEQVKSGMHKNTSSIATGSAATSSL